MKLPNFHLFKKSFVSLVITPTKLQAVKFNNSKDKALILAQKDIPPGIIVNYRVSAHEELVKKIRDMWSENKIDEKFVGVVVPEFSTYTKSVTLPNLSNNEINEALVWQLEEFLPVPLDKTIVDWKTISRTHENVEIQVTAILKDVLYGYIDAVGDAGLSPLVVETPSLSLERISHSPDNAQLLLHVNKPEAIIAITNGSRVVASSVVTSKNSNIILNTVIQMMSHYKSINVKNIVISGVDLNQDLIQKLHNNVGLPVKLLQRTIAGVDAKNLQNYLIPISLQFKESDEPASDNTINLLPPNWAILYGKKQKYIKSWTLTLVVSIFTWMTFLASFVVMMLLNLQAEDFSNNISNGNASEIIALAQDVKDANNNIDKYLQITDSIYSFQAIANEIKSISKATPGVEIFNYNIDLKNGEISVTGNSTSRDGLLKFKESIESSDNFININLPLSFILKENDIDFEMKANIKDLFNPAKQQVKLNI